ncbi:hypothetical protein FRC08_010685, partial [Ceratobasidium sp. 394]
MEPRLTGQSQTVSSQCSPTTGPDSRVTGQTNLCYTVTKISRGSLSGTTMRLPTTRGRQEVQIPTTLLVDASMPPLEYASRSASSLLSVPTTNGFLFAKLNWTTNSGFGAISK